MNDGTETVVTSEEVFAPEQPRDDHGRFTPTEKEETPAAVGSEPGEVTQEPEEKLDHRVPLPQYMDERDKRQEAERQAAAHLRRVQDLERQWQELQKPKRERPDSILDPDGFDIYQEARVNERVQSVEQMVQNRILDMTFAEQDEANPEEFGKAFNAMKQATVAGDPVVNRIKNAPNPGKALMRWHNQQEALREVGGDFGKFKQKYRGDLMKDPEFRKEFMEAMDAEARGGNGADSRSSNVSSLPSLNRMTGSGNRPSAPLGGRELFEATFSPRKRGGG